MVATKYWMVPDIAQSQEGSYKSDIWPLGIPARVNRWRASLSVVLAQRGNLPGR